VNLALTARDLELRRHLQRRVGTTVTDATDVDGRLTITSDDIELIGNHSVRRGALPATRAVEGDIRRHGALQ
jgi:hypothetical protein